MAIGELPTANARRTHSLGPLVVIVVGYITLLVALRLAVNAPDALSDGPPTCHGEIMAGDAVCEMTRRENIGRTGRIVWYEVVEEELDYDQVAAVQDGDAQRRLWFLGMLMGTAGTIAVLAGTRWLLTWRTWPASVYLASATLLPLLAATAVVGWSELRFAPDDRPGVFVWSSPDVAASAVVMLGLIIMGTVAALSEVPTLPSQPAAAGVRGRTFAGHPLAGWWERVLARLIDAVVLAIAIAILGAIIAIIAFVVARPLVGDETAAAVMNVATVLLGLLVVVGYEAQIADDKGEGNTLGKKALKLRVLPLETASAGSTRVSEGSAFLRALVWWAPIVAVGVASTDLGIVGPIPYAYLLFMVPLLNGTWPLWDRRLRQSLNDRFARTVVVRTG